MTHAPSSLPRSPRISRRPLVFLYLILILFMAASVPATAVFGAQSLSELRSQLRRALHEQRMTAVYGTLEKLVARNTAPAVDVIVDNALTHDHDVDRAVGAAFVNLPPGPAHDRVVELTTEHDDYRVRVLLTLVAARRSDRESYKALLTNLYDPMDSVALAAIEGIEEKGDLGAVAHLISALRHREEGGKRGTTVWYELRRSLKSLTGQDFEYADEWKNFWDAHGENFQPPPPDERKKEVTSVADEPPVFFGHEVVTERVLFVLDISGSMAIKDPAPEETGADGRRGRTGVDDPRKKEPEPAEMPESRMRLRRVQRALIDVITKLPPQTRFNIITFNHQVQTYRDGLTLATPATKQRAIQFVRDFNADGETWTDHALQRAFDMPEINVIFLLSDGAPRRNNELLPIDPILEWVREQNRFRRIRIHTVGFEQAGKTMRKFLAKLALQNNGLYKELR